MCSLSLEHTGLIIHASFEVPLPFYLEFDPFTLEWLFIIGDLFPCMFKSFLVDGAGDLKMLFPFESGVELKFVFDLVLV